MSGVPIANWTPNQLPLDAILDINGKQTYLGNTFLLPAAGLVLADTSEDPISLIVNPVGSGKSLFFFSRTVTTNNNNVILNYYFNPVPNVLGSPTTAINLRTSSTTASIAKAYLGSTVTSTGTLFNSLLATVYLIGSDLLFIVDPGSSVLITGKQVGSGSTTVYSENVWYEI
jgi:hypothetical protein